MDPPRVLSDRLATQRLSSAPVASAADAVRLLTCVQSQERDHAFFSLAMRSTSATYAALRAEHDAGAFLRTHILRPTWHFVAPEDLRWILELTSPRVLSGMAGRHRQLGLDDPRRLGDGLELVAELLQDKPFRTRHEIGAAFNERGSSITAGQELGHLLLVAELRGLICSGPMSGVHHTYALVDEVVAPAPARERDAALRELVRRFFVGHGPASVKDFTRWSSLTGADTKAALADLGDDLEQVEVSGVPHWRDPAAVPRRRRGAPAAYLLPVYDEVILTYPQVTFPAAPDHPFAERPDPFWARVVLDGVNVGLWKRTVTSDVVEVDVRLAPSVSPRGREQVRIAAQRLAGFLGRDLSYAENEGRPHLWRG
ncbi:winged helix DNA-binding domain-containing protein [Nostocoides sp. HKS02]|uniref:winged helix DNA-binding domain-containing protein n=1 Tax=Nostocoides sp. HKS02 TaxID=1813880 RepID=UPI0012B4EAAF|nr:winged helix DNA-binding domain-containing protein [Tetrasphaera sp. HKS02]QGN57681.1 winged helix DNA-binding domain-containing protein [Tetrasphaera sp. HKS02]